MTPENKVLVQQSFARIAPIADVAANLFYSRLFELDPTLRPLFKEDLTEQKRNLMQTLAVVVHGLDELDSIVPAVQALGRRHGRYGVQAEHYDTVGSALLWTVGQGLGEGFTPAVAEAWTEAYQLVATTMKEAQAEAQPVAG
jgi:hemoglobin-like flavoprotein